MEYNMPNESKKAYSHYYKKIPDGVAYIDVYRVLELFGVNDPAIQHAVKKLLVAGGRGHKNLEKDVKEAVDSLNRWIEMREEEHVQIGPKSSVTEQELPVGTYRGTFSGTSHKYFDN
jgi:hypothetical protein